MLIVLCYWLCLQLLHVDLIITRTLFFQHNINKRIVKHQHHQPQHPLTRSHNNHNSTEIERERERERERESNTFVLVVESWDWVGVVYQPTNEQHQSRSLLDWLIESINHHRASIMFSVDDVDIDDDRSSTSTQAQQVLSSSQLNEALIEAVCEGSILKVQSLLDQHADIHTRTGDMRETPLHLASKYGHHQCIELLLDRLADTNARCWYSCTPLHEASFYGHRKCIELLLDRHANINARCCASFTPLHEASFYGHHQCIELLIDHGADKSIINVRLVW